MRMLLIHEIETYYGKTKALRGVSLEVQEGELVVLIGANGAGKTTTLKAVSGLIRPAKGRIELSGQRIDHLEAEEIVKMGVAHVPEGRGIFANMTVLENLELGACTRKGREGTKQDVEEVFTHFPVLKTRMGQLGGTLSGGEQQMLTMGRGLMIRPKLYLLDEPSVGLAPLMVELLFGIIKDINHQGTTVFMVEQNARMALRLAKRGYVLETGKIALHGQADQLAGNDHVRRAYLGL
jgi:branched-chain amino acid transport system ATP-binding protein